MEETVEQLVAALLGLDSAKVGSILAGLANDSEIRPYLDDAVIASLEKIGCDWENGQVSLSQVYMAGRICEQAVSGMLVPIERPLTERPRLAIAVLEDHHALGKRMVKSALHAAGYQLMDYGHGCRAQDLVEAVVRDDIDVLLLSCLMLASGMRVGEVVEGLKRAGRSTVVVVGGAPFRLDERLWQDVGAWAMGRNSTDAVAIVKSLSERRPWA